MKLKEFRMTEKNIIIFSKDGSITLGNPKVIYGEFKNTHVEPLGIVFFYGTYAQGFEESEV